MSASDPERWSGKLRFRVDDQLELELEANQSLDELGAAFLRATGAAPIERRESLVLSLGPEHWFQLECQQGVALGAWLASWDPPPGWVSGDPLPLLSAREQLCMHSSPAVPGRGYACGWC